MWSWNKALDADPIPAQTVGDLTDLLYVAAVKIEIS
jgi:hypothetical protein